MNESKIWNLVTGLSTFGIFLALFLLYNYYALSPSRLCTISVLVNCKAVIRGGSLSELFGVPVAVYGLAGYIVILYSSFIKNKKLLFATVLFGTLFCLRITILEVFLVKVFCPICLACQVVMFIIFGLSIYLLKSK
jgi:uncharacterized membrane protein